MGNLRTNVSSNISTQPPLPSQTTSATTKGGWQAQAQEMTGADNTKQSLAVRLQQQIGLRKSLTDLTEGLDTGSDPITTQAWLDSVTKPSGLPLPKHPSLLQGFGFISSQCPPQRLAGRTQYHMDNWKRVTEDPWVLHIAEGYEQEFESPPYQSCQLVTRASVPPFQDGRSSPASRPVTGRGLNVQDRPKGRIICHPNCFPSPEISEVQLEKSNFPVYLPSVWSLNSTTHLNKVVETSGRASS